jgi:hypothetical protein
MRSFLLLVNDSITLLNAELNDKKPTKNDKLGNFNIRGNSFFALFYTIYFFYVSKGTYSLNYILNGGLTTTLPSGYTMYI